MTSFVFDLSTPEILLLDRFHQALSFGDMAVAVQTRAPAALLDFSCAQKPLQFDARDATRPLLAALLQTTWGVAPTYVLCVVWGYPHFAYYICHLSLTP